MIDIESFVFDTVYNQLIVLHPSANISAGYDEKDTVFPTVVIRETGNMPYQSSNTDNCAENHTRVTYEVSVTSDKTGEARSECKELLKDADTIMQSMKFRRIYKSYSINIGRTSFRQYARYEAIVGKPVVVNAGQQNEKTVYQMYRR